jgi:hypothetical protein
MDAAAAAFYRVYASLRPGGIPDAGGRARLQPVLSARLNGLVAAAAQADARFHARIAVAPPLLEGDIFSSLFEGATAWTVSPCAGDARTARCSVSLTHAAPGAAPVTWKDTLYLVREGTGWRVDDIGYDAGFAFGNTGRLSGTLASAIRMAGP